MVKRFLSCLAVCLAPTLLAAQDSSLAGGLTVRSTPPAALVTLDGIVTVTGITPTTLQHRLAGQFKLTVKKPLFETYKTTLFLEPGRSQSIDVNLSPKTRFKGAVRSMFIPGWGQLYSEQKGKSILFAALAVTSASAFIIADHNFQIKYDRYQESEEAYRSARDSADYETLKRLDSQRRLHQQEAFDSEDIRRGTIGAMIGVWAVNVLDVLFFFPENKANVTIQGITVTPTTDQKSFGLVLSRNF